jgi:hypothetical protein
MAEMAARRTVLRSPSRLAAQNSQDHIGHHDTCAEATKSNLTALSDRRREFNDMTDFALTTADDSAAPARDR